MKKLTLFTVALATIATLGGQSLTAQASSSTKQIQFGGSKIIIAYDENCNNTLFEQICDYLNSIPNCPPTVLPEENLPGINCPEQQQPGPNTSEQNKPEQNNPEQTVPGDNNDDSSDNSNLTFEEQVVALVNAERAKEGLSPLTMDSKLQSAARVRAKEIQTSFSHTRPDGTSFATVLKENDIAYRNAGENIAWGQQTPEEVVIAWMNSAGHRANIMSTNFSKIGVGCLQNARGVNYWAQLFTN